MLVDCCHTEEHEDDGLGRTAQHLHGIFYCRVRLVGYVCLHVVLHRDTAESYTVIKKSAFIYNNTAGVPGFSG